MVKMLLPAVLLVVVALGGCSLQLEYNAPETSAVDVPTASVTPTAPPVTAPAPPVPVTKPGNVAPASVDYVTPVTNRWHGCFTKLGVGDLYYDATTSTVVGGPVTWSVGPGNLSGTPADAASTAALAGC